MSVKYAKYSVIIARTEFVLIKDVGPWDEFLTVTNAAESVIQELWVKGHLRFQSRVFYVDTDGEVDELRYSIYGGPPRFTGYASILQQDTIGQFAIQKYEELKKS